MRSLLVTWVLHYTEDRETATISQVELRHFHHKSTSEILMIPLSMLQWPGKCSKPHF